MAHLTSLCLLLLYKSRALKVSLIRNIMEPALISQASCLIIQTSFDVMTSYMIEVIHNQGLYVSENYELSFPEAEEDELTITTESVLNSCN